MYVLDTVQKPERKTRTKSESATTRDDAYDHATKLGGSGPRYMCRGKRVDAVDACTAGDVKSGRRARALGPAGLGSGGEEEERAPGMDARVGGIRGWTRGGG